MKITWYGTAAISIETEKTRLLFDPFVPWPGSGVPVALSDYGGFRHIFLTHGHFDHAESLPRILKRNPDASVCCTETPYQTLRNLGIEKKRLRKITWGKQTFIGDIRIRAYASRHASLEIDLKDRILDLRLLQYCGNLPRMLYGNLIFRENGETLLYEIYAEKKRVLLMGSLNLLDAVRYPKDCDILILPYAGYTDNYPVAEKILRRFRPAEVILTHFDDTFPPMTRPVDLSRILACEDCTITVPEYRISLIR